MRGLDGRSYLVAGGASGMGAATVERLVQEGARVTVLDRDAEGIDRLIGTLPPDDAGRVLGVTADITRAEEIDAALAETEAWGGPLSGAVNTAGIGASCLIDEQPLEALRRVYEVNVFGMYNLVRAQGRVLAAHGAGAIVNFSSTNARQPAAGLSAYASSKAAVGSLTEVAAIELGRSGVRVVALAPGLTRTPMVERFLADAEIGAAFVENTLLSRPAEPSEVAATAAFLLSDDASYLTGQTIWVDGGSLTQRYPTAQQRRLT